MSALMPPAANVEVILLSEDAGTLRYRTRRAPLPDQLHPDDLAKNLAGLAPCTPGALLHSTSWRYEQFGLVLTYVALPDLDPDSPTTLLPVDAMAASTSPLVPSPMRISLDAVAAHAGRHLAFLHRYDLTVTATATVLPELWELLTKLTPGTAGALHDLHG